MPPSQSPDELRPLAYNIKDTCRLLGIGATTFYELVRRGQIDAIKICGKTLATAESVHALIPNAPRVGERGAAPAALPADPPASPEASPAPAAPAAQPASILRPGRKAAQ
jgi:excisionase family DNA binding protein